MVLLMLAFYSCAVYRPVDILASSDRLKIYWLNPVGKAQPILMAEDSAAIIGRFNMLFDGKAVSPHLWQPDGRIDFLNKNMVTLECYYALGTCPWIAYTYGRDTIFLDLSDNAAGLLEHYKAPKPERFAWLEGTWVTQDNSRPIYEEWTIGANHYPVGKSYSIYAGDTTINEELWIKPEHSQISYVARVLNQNGGRPVYFDWKPNNEDYQLAFANPAHDFPQNISYKLITRDSLVAIIKGQGSSFEIGMKKIATKSTL